MIDLDLALSMIDSNSDSANAYTDQNKLISSRLLSNKWSRHMGK